MDYLQSLISRERKQEKKNNLLNLIERTAKRKKEVKKTLLVNVVLKKSMIKGDVFSLH
jgi:hypothetical protein